MTVQWYLLITLYFGSQRISGLNRINWTLTVGRGEWQTSLETTSTMTADENTFYLMNHITAYEGDDEVFKKTWKTEVPRDFI